MASTSFTFNTLQRRELFSFSTCKCFSSCNNVISNSHSSLSPSFAFSYPKHILQPKLSFFLVKAPVTLISPVNSRSFGSLVNSSSLDESVSVRPISEKLGLGYYSSSGSVEGVVEEKIGKGFVKNGKNNGRVNFGKGSEKGSGFSSTRSIYKRAERKMDESLENVGLNNGHCKKSSDSDKKGEKGSGISSQRVTDDSSAILDNRNLHGQFIKDNNTKNGSKVKKKKEKLSKKGKAVSPEFQLRIGLDMCSKKGDVMGAIALYDSAVKGGLKMGQYHYTVLLYLCSSAAMGVIRPAKSGSGTRSLDTVAPQTLDEVDDSEDDDDDTDDDALDEKDQSEKMDVVEIRVSDDVKKYALERGFEIYERMCLDKVQMNEAALTSVARMAMGMGDGDMAFDMVKQMKSMGINPKLRSYGPALSVFSNNGEIDKAFAVEEHMLENGVRPEEPELEALLSVSIQTGKADRVYYLLHKLRTNVRSVSTSTADLIEKWFKSKEASRIGKRKWNSKMIAETMENVGGGWHGQGWLGRGRWTVSRTSVGADGLCKCCGEKLALIDLDPEETEKFAESVASLAIKREKNSSFQKFQKWLDYYGPFDAVVDAANVGLYSQRKFKPSKVNVIANGIRQMLPSRKWPLIILHNRRLTGSNMDTPINKALVDRWRNADALYATPTGSNDDWYWLYAAIKYKCLLVTNDEMRDHTFQLLGTDFFPKWKERHQVRFTFSEVGPTFHMPPPCSVVIQESERGHWHIPIASADQSEEDRIWLCILRPNLLDKELDPVIRENHLKDSKDEKECANSKPESQLQVNVPPKARSKRKAEELVSKCHRDLKDTLSEPISSCSDHTLIWKAIRAAEELGGCVIDFQI